MEVNCCILIQISLKFVLKGPTNHMSSLVQTMALHQAGVNPLSEPAMDKITDTYMHQSVQIYKML